MCTAITYYTKEHYFGRNLDLEYSYQETVTVTPRNYILSFRHKEEIKQHFAIIGMAYVADDYPLYYDAVNEAGLGMAGLNFPGNAVYRSLKKEKDNITPFELIPWILGQCSKVEEAVDLLKRINICEEAFSKELPLTPLHWLISDKEKSITLEAVKEGITIYHNPVGVLTNNPPFDYQLFSLNNYRSLSNKEGENTFSGEKELLKLDIYSRGMGAIGLPGDASSMSRFVRASFVKMNSVSKDSEEESVSQFFHILRSVEMQRGCVKLEDGSYEITRYSSCCNMDRGIYYYTTYDNHQISAVEMKRENLEGDQLINFPLNEQERIFYVNRE